MKGRSQISDGFVQRHNMATPLPSIISDSVGDRPAPQTPVTTSSLMTSSSQRMETSAVSQKELCKLLISSSPMKMKSSCTQGGLKHTHRRSHMHRLLTCAHTHMLVCAHSHEYSHLCIHTLTHMRTHTHLHAHTFVINLLLQKPL